MVRFFAWSSQGGCFLNYDHVSAPGPVIAEVYRKQREQQFPNQRRSRSGSSPEQPGRGAPRSQPIFGHLEWLKQAGFDEVDYLWKDRRDAIMGGFKH